MRVRHPMFAAMLVAAGLLAPGHALAQNDPDSVKQMVSAAKKQVPLVNMEQFKAGFDKNDLGLIVDMRNPDD